MTAIDFNAFGGMEGSVKQARLRDFRLASYALNTRLWDGSLRAYRKPRLVGDCKCSNFSVGPDGLIACMPACYQEARSPCGAKSVYTLAGGKIAQDGRVVGLDRPTQTPTAAALGLVGGNTDSMIFRILCVNDSEESSAPSAPSSRIEARYGQPISISWSGCSPYRVEALLTQSIPGTKRQVGAETSTWVSVGEFTGSVANFTYEPESWDLTSDGYDPTQYCNPPELDCFVVTEDGFFVGWKGSTIHVSERNDPSKFYRAAIKNLHTNIREMVTAAGVIYIATDSGLFAAGVAPDKDGGPNLVINKFYENGLPIKGTLSLSNSGAIYATRFGLFALNGINAAPQNISSSLVHEDEWECDYLPRHGAAQRGVYYGSNGKTAWHMDYPGTAGAAEFGRLVLLDDIGSHQKAGADGFLYYSDPEGVKVFDRGAGYQKAIWESNEVFLPSRTSMSRIKVRGENVELATFEVLMDGKVVSTKVGMKSGEICTLPLCAVGSSLAVRITLPEAAKEVIITSVQIATSVADLARLP